MDTISEFAKSYNLSGVDTSALTGLIYGYYEGRIKTSDLERVARNYLANSMSCRGHGMDNFEQHLEKILTTFRKFNLDHHMEAAKIIKQVVERKR